MELSTKEKYKKLGLDNLSKNDVYKIYIDKEYDKIYNNTSVRVKEPKNKKRLDKDDNKYKVVLQYINKLLKEIGKDEIDDICMFKNIDRRELVNIDGNKIVDDSLKDILNKFTKDEIGYYQKNSVKHYIINLLKHLLERIGYTIKSCRKSTFDKEYWIEYTIV